MAKVSGVDPVPGSGGREAVSVALAKAQLAGLIHAAEAGEVVRISRRGKPVAVLLSEGAYRRLTGGGPVQDSWSAIQQWRAAGDTRQPSHWLEPLDDSDAWRDRSPARPVDLQ